jgi:hypothetical protein
MTAKLKPVQLLDSYLNLAKLAGKPLSYLDFVAAHLSDDDCDTLDRISKIVADAIVVADRC